MNGLALAAMFFLIYVGGHCFALDLAERIKGH